MSAADADQRAVDLVARMTLDEKIQLVNGRVGWPVGPDGAFLRPPSDPQPAQIVPPPGAVGSDGFVPGIPRLGLPALHLCGASVGVTNLGRHREGGVGTVFPAPIGQTASWDPEVPRLFGAALAREAAAQGINVLLAGATNLALEPRCGRLFEYHGEDPLLAARMVSGELIGTREGGVLASIKHFAANFQETGRFVVNSVVDERALRQGELLTFELAIEWARPAAVMCSYNKVNGTYASENRQLLTEILKQEWGYPGWVMSDWGATHSTVAAALAGLDQEFPMNEFFGARLAEAVERGDVPTERLDDMVHRIVRSMIDGGIVDAPRPTGPVDFAASREVAERIAERSIVLLRNDGLLPLAADDGLRIAVIGGHADVAVLSGGGSASMEPVGGDPVTPYARDRDMFTEPVWVPSSPVRALAAANPGGEVTYTPGGDLDAAVAAAATADVAVVVATQWATEQHDLPDLSLPDGQDRLIEAVAAANPRTVVVLETGGPVLTDWSARVGAVLAAWYPGQRGGEAIASILFGAVTPSAKLPVTFPRSVDDLPHRHVVPVPVRPGHTAPDDPPPHDSFDWVQQPYDAVYDEGLAIGYKWYDSRGIEPAFCFGHGLSYTTFRYADLDAVVDGNAVRVRVTVENTGERPGAEVVQVYAALPDGLGEPPRRLVGWGRVELAPGAARVVEVRVPAKSLAVWAGRWTVPEGMYRFYAAASSRDIRGEVELAVRGLNA